MTEKEMAVRQLVKAVEKFFDGRGDGYGDKVFTHTKNHSENSKDITEMYSVLLTKQTYDNLKTAFDAYKKSIGKVPEVTDAGHIFRFVGDEKFAVYRCVALDGYVYWMDQNFDIKKFNVDDRIILEEDWR